jgi:hypothetical protein
MTLSVLDREGRIHRQQSFPYALFSYKEKWVALTLDTPLLLNDLAGERGDLTVAFDPQAGRYKGIYFHYSKNPKTSHSFVGTVARGFKPVSDREWMVRLYLKSRKPQDKKDAVDLDISANRDQRTG